jgi:peptide/nickel transport system permease protein
VKKVARTLLALFIIFTLNFLIPRAMPGDPLMNLIGEDALVDEAALMELRHEMGLDAPLPVQYLRYWRDLFRLDLGHSFHLHAPVVNVLAARMPWTLALMGIALLLGSAAGTWLGALSGWARDSRLNRAASMAMLAVYSMPPFFLALVLLYLMAFKLGLFPLHGFYETGTPLDLIRHFTLPVLTLTFFLTARNFLIMRGSVLIEKARPYVTFARAKGLTENLILWRHVLKNAALPVLTLAALDFGFIFSGALFVEIVFSMNGMGTLIYDALLSRDYPLLQGAFLVITLMVVLANLAADRAYAKLDPRVGRIS